jgi:hypothetical protein
MAPESSLSCSQKPAEALCNISYQVSVKQNKALIIIFRHDSFHDFYAALTTTHASSVASSSRGLQVATPSSVSEDPCYLHYT